MLPFQLETPTSLSLSSFRFPHSVLPGGEGATVLKGKSPPRGQRAHWTQRKARELSTDTIYLRVQHLMHPRQAAPSDSIPAG